MSTTVLIAIILGVLCAAVVLAITTHLGVAIHKDVQHRERLDRADRFRARRRRRTAGSQV